MEVIALLVAISAQVPAPPALAQPSQSEIVVQGLRSRNKQIQSFVKALTPAPVGGQLARYDEAVCPAAVGLSDRQNDEVRSRMELVANAVGIGVAKAGCAPNALVIVVDKKDEFITALRKEHPSYFRNAYGDLVRTPREAGPATAWHVEGILDANGIKPTLVKTPDGGKFFVVNTMDSSRLKPGARPHFVAGVLVIEVGALAGLTTTQLADYAAMRIYGKTEPARLANTATASILTVVDTPMHAQVPITLTQWDLTFLKSLYASEPVQYATQHRADIAREFRKELDRAVPKTR